MVGLIMRLMAIAVTKTTQQELSNGKEQDQV